MPGRTIRVVNQSALQRLLHELAERLGSQKAAAGELGLSQATYSRLASGNRKRVALATVVEMFHRLCGRGGAEGEFAAAPRGLVKLVFTRIPTPHEMRFKMELESRGQIATPSAPSYDPYRYIQLLFEAFVDPAMQGVEAKWLSWVHREYTELIPRYESLVRRLWDREATRQEVARFLESVGWSDQALPPLTRQRTWVALCRAVRDLDAADHTEGAEPGWQDLREEGRLASVLKFRFAAEQVLMRGQPDDEEGNFLRVLEGAPSMTWNDYMAWMNGPWED